MLSTQYLRQLSDKELLRIAKLELDPLTCTPWEAELLRRLDKDPEHEELAETLDYQGLSIKAANRLLVLSADFNTDEVSDMLQFFKQEDITDCDQVRGIFTRARAVLDAAKDLDQVF